MSGFVMPEPVDVRCSNCGESIYQDDDGSGRWLHYGSFDVGCDLRAAPTNECRAADNGSSPSLSGDEPEGR